MENMKYFCWMLVLLLCGCVEDESRYGGIEIDEITIEGIEEYREIEFGGRLMVTPIVTTKFGESSDLSYVWYKYNEEQTLADTLSFEKNLDVEISDVLPGVETTLTFKVIDNQTGVYALHNSTFKTVGLYAGGTLMLCENDGACDLSMLKKDGRTLYENIYSLQNNGEKLGLKSRRLFLTNNFERNPLPYKAVVVACDDETGGVYLDPDVLVRKNYMREKFVLGEDLSGDLVITHICNSQSTEYMIVNGKVHGRELEMGVDVANYNPEIMVLSEPSDYSVAAAVAQPSITPYYGKPMFYDNLHGRFMANISGGYFTFAGGDLKDFSAFDPTDMGKNLQMVASGTLNSSLNAEWALMKNAESGEYVLLTYEIVADVSKYPTPYGFVTRSKRIIAQNSCPGMYVADRFIPANKVNVTTMSPWVLKPTGLSGMLFYLADNKVYAFNVQTQSEGVLVDGEQEGYDITSLDCTEIGWKTAEDLDATIVQLTLGIKDLSLSGKQGGIATYKLDNIGGLSARKLYAKAGFCDRVIFTIEKED